MTEDSANQTTLGHGVFVSYASQDAAVANAVVENLERYGIKCWIAPRDVTPGSQYADEIVGAINDAKVLILVLSENAVSSPHVGREVERAASKRRGIIALKTDAAPLTRSFEYFLSESQWIDVAALGMPAALEKLTQAVRQRVSPSWVSPGLGADVRNPEDRKRGPSYLTIKRMVAAAVFLAVAALVAGVAVRYWPSKQEGRTATVTAISEKSIAVLPFVDMSEKKDQEYFADGMAEEIIDLLVKIPGLKVIGRTSSFQFKGKSEDLRAIGARLNAAYILEGSVRKSGEQIRVTAQLINSETGAHEWSETYDREIRDVLKLQDAIAASVVRGFELAIDTRHFNAGTTLKNADAYDLILRGRYAADRYDKEGLDEAVTLFQQALDIDAASVNAAAGLAWAYYNQGAYGFRPADMAFEQARSAAALSLKLDARSWFAHALMGSIHMVYDWDWAAAAAEFQQQATLAPGSVYALDNKAWLSLALGRWDDALRQVKTAILQDPLCPNCYENLMWAQMGRGHLDEAEAAMRRVLDIVPTYGWGRFELGLVLLARGHREAALLEMKQETTEAARQAGLAMAYYALGRKTDSDAALATMLKERAAANAFEVANVYAFRAMPDKAIEWLERAYIQKDVNLFLVKSYPPLKAIQEDSRYKAFLKKMNLPSD
jgi:TolB-like protein